ncbi:MAG: DNA cytosine methyltransferase [Ignavibacteria bacterium]|nr:DNA cytosine methyltransferase [Ignavibacteria bacterium]
MTVHNHIARSVGAEVQQRIDALKIGQKMQDLPEELWHPSFRYYVKEDPNRKGGPNLRMMRLDPEKPSLTVTGYIFNKFVHPFENRFITVREAARLQGFPDEVPFCGTLTSSQLQVGNAVPVPLARAVLTAVAEKAHLLSMREVRALSLFSGAGGFDIGAERVAIHQTRIRPLVALENWNDACETLRNYAGSRINIAQNDIRTVASPLDFWHEKTGLDISPNLVYGGPPCQAFSQAGKQKADDDERGMLIFEFVRFVSDLQPEFFVMENVANLKGVAGGTLLKRVVVMFKELGYNLDMNVLDATHYGAAQRRNRLFIIGCRQSLGKIALPEPTHGEVEGSLFPLKPIQTVGQAFERLPSASFSNATTSTIDETLYKEHLELL